MQVQHPPATFTANSVVAIDPLHGIAHDPQYRQVFPSHTPTKFVPPAIATANERANVSFEHWIPTSSRDPFNTNPRITFTVGNDQAETGKLARN